MQHWIINLIRLAALLLIIALPLGSYAVLQPAPADAVVQLQQRIDSGEVRLQFESPRGYLDSLLKSLDIPVSSQTFVFSKTSLQSSLIAPETPRALYFNDDVYVGWVRNGPVIELASVDPVRGTVFYTLDQEPAATPKFKREDMRCTSCHLPARVEIPVPRLMVMSILPSTTGSVLGTEVFLTSDESPMNTRWGGWYVTGTHGDMFHRGNRIFGELRTTAGVGPLNRTDLSDRFDTSPYPHGHSDIIALTLLVHQSHIHNLIGETAYAVRGTTDPGKVAEITEPLVRALLFVGAPALQAKMKGTSGFAEDFSKRGVRDGRGRSLRDLDLEGRLFRYPLSYLIHSEQFSHLPAHARDYVYRRLSEVLTGRDKSPDFQHLSAADRTAILEILEATEPAFDQQIVCICRP